MGVISVSVQTVAVRPPGKPWLHRYRDHPDYFEQLDKRGGIEAKSTFHFNLS